MTDKNCPVATDLALLIIRVALASVFIYHGYGKVTDIAGTADMFGKGGIPMPMVSAVLAASAEFGGGILVGLGLLTRLACIPMAFTMAVAVFHVHWPNFGMQNHGFEYAMTLGLVLIAMGLLGPGRVSLDHVFFSKWCGKCCHKEAASCEP